MLDQHYICVTCGTQYTASAEPPAHCPICEDERQYIGWEGQQWTTIEKLRDGHHNMIKTIEPGLTGIGSYPSFAIGQRALLVHTDEGNILWDCISLLDEPTITVVKCMGGIAAIAISHPHFYSSMVQWARTFNAPIYLPASDRQWVMRPDSTIDFWQGTEKKLPGGLTVIRCGGHFAGSSVLHWPGGANDKGVLLTGDTLQVVQDRRYVSFMRSYPDLIPLPAATVRRIVAALQPYPYERIYGGWWDRFVAENAKAGVIYSAERYVKALAEG